MQRANMQLICAYHFGCEGVCPACCQCVSRPQCVSDVRSQTYTLPFKCRAGQLRFVPVQNIAVMTGMLEGESLLHRTHSSLAPGLAAALPVPESWRCSMAKSLCPVSSGTMQSLGQLRAFQSSP